MKQIRFQIAEWMGRWSWLILGVSILLLALAFGVNQVSQSFYFQDETEHVTVGWMVGEHGKRLYTDLSTNHQPIPVMWGMLTMKLAEYATLFDLIEQVRWGMFLLAVMWIVGLAWRFRWAGLLAAAFTYTLGYYFFGWHVLAESVVVGEVMWLMLMVFTYGFLWQRPSGYWEWLDPVVSGVALVWIWFSLLPLWPFALLAGLGLCYWSSRRQRWILSASVLVGVVAMFLWVDPLDWWRETVVHNWLYFLPYESVYIGKSWPVMVGYPVVALTKWYSEVARFLGISMLIGVGLVWWLWSRTFIDRQRWVALGVMGLLLVLLNTRVDVVPAAFYSGFHLYPYVAGWAAVLAGLVVLGWQESEQKHWLRVGLGMVVGLLLLNNLTWIVEERDKLHEHVVQYDRYSTYGNVLGAIRQEGDTLLTGPDGHGYINIMANIPTAGRQNFHLDWAYRSPFLLGEFRKMLEENPPTFVYFPAHKEGFFVELEPLLEAEYVELVRPYQDDTDLYMRVDGLSEPSEEQWSQFERWDFVRPGEE